MNAHTPGPWTHTPSREHSNPETTRRDIVADSQFGPAFIAGDVSQHDAQLISAAPNLIAVLSAIVSDYHALQGSQGASASLGAEFTAGEWLGSRLGGHIKRAEMAISKAKGEA
jgi:hypothetical protein